MNARGIRTSWITDVYQKHNLIIYKFTQPITYVQERRQTRSTPKKPKEAVQTCYITLKSILTSTQTPPNLTLNETFSTRAAAVLYPSDALSENCIKRVDGLCRTADIGSLTAPFSLSRMSVLVTPDTHLRAAQHHGGPADCDHSGR